ncbi:MAG TPA: hypothetical protein VIL77_06800, partial [Gaiellaceae bacterium]
MLNWPAHSGYFAALNAFGNGAVARHSASFQTPYDDVIQAWANTDPFTSIGLYSTDLSGSFRLVRTAGTLDAYVRSTGGQWQLVLSTPGMSGSVAYGIGLSSQAWDFGHLDGSVAFDNFRLNSGALTCQSWWQDYAPDIARGDAKGKEDKPLTAVLAELVVGHVAQHARRRADDELARGHV